MSKFKKSILTLFRISFTEFRRWIRNSRLIILGAMLVFIHMLIITPLKECASLMGEPVSAFEAFAALGNSSMTVLIIPVLFLVLMADFPQKDGIDFFYQIRCSKRTWICGQMIFVLETIIFLVMFLAVSSCLMLIGSSTWSGNFSHAVTHFAVAFPENKGSYLQQLIPENLYHHMTLKTAIIHTFFLMTLYFLILAFILLLSALCNSKYGGIIADSLLIISGAVSCAGRMKVMWLFPMAHTISWLHFEEYLKEEIVPIKVSYCYLIGCCVFLFICCMTASQKYQAGKI